MHLKNSRYYQIKEEEKIEKTSLEETFKTPGKIDRLVSHSSLYTNRLFRQIVLI